MSHQISSRLLVMLRLALICACAGMVLPTAAQPPGARSLMPPSQSSSVPQTIRTTISPENPMVGEPIQLQLNLSFPISKLDIPNLIIDGMDVEYLGTQTMAQFGTGGIRRTYQILYNITVDAPGTYEIPPQSLKIRGQTFQTQPVSFTVSKSSDRYWAELELEDDELFVGQIVEAKLKAFFDTSVNVVSHPRQIESQFEGFTRGDWKVDGNRELSRVPSGRQVVVFPYAVAVAPVKAGKLTLAPVKTQWAVESRDSMRPSFPNRGILNMLPGSARAITLATEPVEVTVKPLPEEGRPETFSGAVGLFGMIAKVQPQQVKVGEPLKLSIVINGQGNFERVKEPTLTFNEDHWQTYDSQSEFKPLNDIGTDGQKVFDKIMVPTTTEATLPTIEFSYFDPYQQKYMSVEPVTDLEVEIIGGTPPTQYLQPDETEEEELAAPETEAPEPELEPAVADIRGIRTPANPDRARFISLLGSPVFWGVQAIPLAALLALFLVNLARKRSARQSGEREAARRRQELRQLLQQIETEDLTEKELYTRAGRGLALACADATGEDPDQLDDHAVLTRCTGDDPLHADIQDLLTRKNNYRYGASSHGNDPAPLQERKRVAQILRRFSATEPDSPGTQEGGRGS